MAFDLKARGAGLVIPAAELGEIEAGLASPWIGSGVRGLRVFFTGSPGTTARATAL